MILNLHKDIRKSIHLNPNKRAVHPQSISCSPSFASSFTRFLVYSFSPENVWWTVWSMTRALGYPFALILVVRSLVLPLALSFAFLVVVWQLVLLVCPVLVCIHRHKYFISSLIKWIKAVLKHSWEGSFCFKIFGCHAIEKEFTFPFSVDLIHKKSLDSEFVN